MKNKINVGVLIGLVFGIHFLASAMGVPPIEKTSPAQTASGTVLDGNGQPIQNAFVMLAENPYRCALTGADGAFSVDLSGVTNAKTLRVSAAGMVPVSVALPTLGKLKIQMNAQDTELSKIEVGCNQATFTHPQVLLPKEFFGFGDSQLSHIGHRHHTCVVEGRVADAVADALEMYLHCEVTKV